MDTVPNFSSKLVSKTLECRLVLPNNRKRGALVLDSKFSNHPTFARFGSCLTERWIETFVTHRRRLILLPHINVLVGTPIVSDFSKAQEKVQKRRHQSDTASDNSASSASSIASSSSSPCGSSSCGFSSSFTLGFAAACLRLSSAVFLEYRDFRRPSRPSR